MHPSTFSVTTPGIPFDLCTASSVGDTDWVREKLSNPRFRTLLNVPNKSGWTATMYAAYYGHEDILEILIENGAEVNMHNASDQTALMLSVKCGNLRCCEILVRNGATIDDEDSNHFTSLGYAAIAGYGDLTSFLIKHNAEVDRRLGKQKMTPLMCASEAGHEKIVRILLQAGANPKLKSLNEQTAKDLAYEKGHYKLVSLFTGCQPLTHSPAPFSRLQFSEYPNCSSPVRPAGTPQVPAQSEISFPANIESLLNSLGLSEYMALFEKHNITLQEFMNLSGDQLKKLGVDKLGPRCKMTTAISRLNSGFPQRNSPVNKVVTNRQQLEIDSLKERLARCEAQLLQERLKSVDLNCSNGSGGIRLIQESMQPLFNLEWQSESLKETVKQLREQLWEEHNRVEHGLLSQLFDKVQDAEKLSADMHAQISLLLGNLKQMQCLSSNTSE